MSAGQASAQRFETEKHTLNVETFADGLEHPWGLAFLSDGRVLVSERPGRIRLVETDGSLSAPLEGAPPTRSFGQGGMLDIALDPDFAETSRVFITYAHVEGGEAGTAVWRARLITEGTPRLEDGKTIFRMNKLTSKGQHFGSRIVFAPDKTMWVTVGERGQGERAQDASDHAGSVLRMDRDGNAPAGNPFVGKEGDDLIWSIGHRNPQGAAFNPWMKALWTVEHGARGGDEINMPQAGLNYGWPVISYGTHYSGFKIGEGTEKPGMEQPLYYWDPSIAPSGMEFYTGDAFAGWKGDVFLGALKYQLLVRLTLDGGRIMAEERMLEELGERIRAVKQGPDGNLYLLTDSPDGRILKISPAE
ncbi:MAG: PQQ-dependent sugar dehydrogenase [Rhodobiaceae bacterium]|nr:PQQ-dependent sugar dehydrogenase [Rhodobiaceae bacterium]MCC0049561.1 PQQ-dependent sugar dehydrogenase [Rhodobiaceae bacterium]